MRGGGRVVDKPRSIVVYSKKFKLVDFGYEHPLQAERFSNLRRTLKKEISDLPYTKPHDVSPEVLKKAHSAEYIEKVKEAGRTGQDLAEDTPAFPKIFEWGFLSVKAGLTAADLVLKDYKIVFNPHGGWHHAMRDSGSGFCIFNDMAILAKYLVEKGMKPVIIDIDAHAGNGTFHILEEEPILKISIHQKPFMFYPGEGFQDWFGEGKGTGYIVNVPFPPKSEDGCLLFAFDHLINDLLDRYEFDVIILQGGVDGHTQDPVSDLHYSGLGYVNVAKKLRERGKPIIILGGGGYNLVTSPKLWTATLLTFLGREKRALELVEEVDGPLHAISTDYCAEETKETIRTLRNSHPFFYVTHSE